jgi:hypothetical protein
MTLTAHKAEAVAKAVQLRTALEETVRELSRSDRELWAMRLREVSIWQEVKPASSDPRATKIREQIPQILDRRDAAIAEALGRIRSIDEDYKALGDAFRQGEKSVAAQRKRFAAADEEVARRLVEDPSIVSLDKEEQRLRRLIDLNANWPAEVDELVGKRAATYEGDPVFAYLNSRGFGTDAYSAKWPLSYLDGKLAQWSNYEAEHANLEAVLAYLDEYGRSMEKLAVSVEKLAPSRKAAIRQIKDSLDPEREKLADVLNGAASVSGRFNEAKGGKAKAFKRVGDSISGGDAETRLITEAVVTLIAREHAAAKFRATDAMLAPASAAVDALLRQRIAASRDTDALRNKAKEILDSLSEIQSLLDEAAGREVSSEHFEFAVASAGVALA